ncbi:MAG TPA: hypothetical protein VKA10_01915 [Prolixibacteraceae bacterium]|nr:hypothetical protein [Prolixibacteraceae bacterium]
MKTITGLFLIFTIAVLSSCEGPIGPVGPPGQQGPPGEDGVNILGSVFEIEGDFTADGDYTINYEFPADFEIYDSDVVLVYILWETVNNGELDVWRLLPQTVVLEEGVLQYNYDYTVADVQIYLEGTVPTDLYLPSETDNQIFRVAVIPADFAAKKSVDVSDLNAVMKSLQINPDKLKKFSIQK